MDQKSTSNQYALIVGSIPIMLGMYWISTYNYLLFHSIAEIFSAIVAFGIFMIAWNSRALLEKHYLLLIGIAYFFIGGLDLLHALAYKGMGVFPDHDANLPTQLWIAARYLEAASLFIAPFFLQRKLRADLLFVGYCLITALIIAAIGLEIFPNCFIEGRGLTLFKKVSEYLIITTLFGALLGLLRHRAEFEKNVLRMLAASIVLSMAAELFFTFYISVYGLSNLIGHLFKIISFFLIYRAIITTGLTKPYNILFRELKQNEQALLEANATKNKFFSIISHDLKSMFSGLLMLTRLLYDDYDDYDEPTRRKLTGNIHDSVTKTHSLLENLLTWARAQTGGIKFMPQEIGLAGLGEEITELLRTAAGNKNITLISEIKKEAEVFADPNMIRVVLNNLVSNAIKFTHSGGSIRIFSAPADNYEEITVSDTGIGMNREDVDQLFQIDTKVTRPGTADEQGSGLGLILCRDFIEMNGGKIRVASSPGNGSSFTFTLPQPSRQKTA